ncbi:MAG: NADH-quinone oxidoreductase subunit A [Bacteroidota bacterium]
MKLLFTGLSLVNMENSAISGFGEVLIFVIGGILFLCGGLFTAWIVRPSRPNEEKLTTYESGEEPLGNAWGRINIRFYLVALIFLLFEVEIIFLFPWATVFGSKALIISTDGNWGWFALVEMFVFLGILAIGLAYAWVKGFLDWPKPKVEKKEIDSPVPGDLYQEVNRKYSA